MRRGQKKDHVQFSKCTIKRVSGGWTLEEEFLLGESWPESLANLVHQGRKESGCTTEQRTGR